MPSANPPVDREQADTAPDLVLAAPGAEVRVGELRECATIPPSAFRFAVARVGGRQLEGYLWEVPPSGGKDR